MKKNAGPSQEIFSGDHSVKMWDAINNAKTKDDLRDALYLVCCRLQELESKIMARQGIIPRRRGNKE